MVEGSVEVVNVVSKRVTMVRDFKLKGSFFWLQRGWYILINFDIGYFEATVTAKTPASYAYEYEDRSTVNRKLEPPPLITILHLHLEPLSPGKPGLSLVLALNGGHRNLSVCPQDNNIRRKELGWRVVNVTVWWDSKDDFCEWRFFFTYSPSSSSFPNLLGLLPIPPLRAFIF